MYFTLYVSCENTHTSNILNMHTDIVINECRRGLLPTCIISDYVKFEEWAGRAQSV